ncbi:MAG: glycoside hydrolase family 140 protein [Bacteroides sp.]|nr:glycoside hydrolase family 140 protein [Bacteroides sp.]
MKPHRLIFLLLALLAGATVLHAQKKSTYIPWKNGPLKVSEEGRYLKHENGTPFFWLGETGWLMPQRLNRDEVAYYLEKCRLAGYNMVQVQVLNAVPSYNVYGQPSMSDGFDFKQTDRPGVYGYWEHMDYIIDTAASKGIYIGMVCIWGGLVNKGDMDRKQAVAYGTFLANRYKECPNIIWIIGGDIRGDKKTEVWETLAQTIRRIDSGHLMTFHPRGRTTSATWFNDRDWLDFNMFQSGHRRYGQRKGDADYPIAENTEEDNWRYVEKSQTMTPLKPVIDDEPIYEDIPQGLHGADEPRWEAHDVRRYAYWSVFAGSFGHTYGHNAIMQFVRPGYLGAYSADGRQKAWWDALEDPGFNQMKHLKNLMLAFPYFERVPDQSIIAGQNGERYDRLLATRGTDYLLVYNYSGRPMEIDLTRISGEKKNLWWYSPQTGRLEYIGEFDSRIHTIQRDGGYMRGEDRVLIAIDSTKTYIHTEWQELPEK